MPGGGEPPLSRHVARGSVVLPPRSRGSDSRAGPGKRASMNHGRRLLALAIVTGLLSAVAPVAVGAGRPAAPRPDRPRAVPQAPVAQAAAQWLADQLSPEGWMPNSPGSTTPSLSFTANTVVALAASGVDPSGAAKAVEYLEGNVDAFVTQDGADGPGQLALLIVDAEATGVDPTDFGGTNLVARLLATEQPSGLFGTDAQLPLRRRELPAGPGPAGPGRGRGQGPGPAAGAAISFGRPAVPGRRVVVHRPGHRHLYGAPPTTPAPTPTRRPWRSRAWPPRGRHAGHRLGGPGLPAQGRDADGGWSYYPSSAATPRSPTPTPRPRHPGPRRPGPVAAGPAFTTGSTNPVSALLAFRLTPGPAPGRSSSRPAGVRRHPGHLPGGTGHPGHRLPARAAAGGVLAGRADGGVFAFGPGYYGSLPGLGVSRPRRRRPGPPPTAGATGAAADGGVFAFGDAGFAGSLAGLGSTRAPSWAWRPRPTVAATGWSAPTAGCSPSATPASPAPCPARRPRQRHRGHRRPPPSGGYWLVGADGGVFAFGDAGFAGSLPGLGVRPATSWASRATAGGRRLLEVGADGGVFAFGDAGVRRVAPGSG